MKGRTSFLHQYYLTKTLQISIFAVLHRALQK